MKGVGVFTTCIVVTTYALFFHLERADAADGKGKYAKVSQALEKKKPQSCLCKTCENSWSHLIGSSLQHPYTDYEKSMAYICLALSAESIRGEVLPPLVKLVFEYARLKYIPGIWLDLPPMHGFVGKNKKNKATAVFINDTKSYNHTPIYTLRKHLVKHILDQKKLSENEWYSYETCAMRGSIDADRQIITIQGRILLPCSERINTLIASQERAKISKKQKCILL